MDALIKLLHDGGHSLVVETGGTVRTFGRRGVADLYRLLTEEPAVLREAAVADKVVGKGAAALMALGGVHEVYAEVASTSALILLRENGIRVSCGQEVPNIINRRGDGICPVELLCRDCATAAECLPPISDFMASQNQRGAE